MSVRGNKTIVTGEEEKVSYDPLKHYTGVFLSFLQSVFGRFPAGEFRWSADENATEIMITDQAPIESVVVEKRPAIVVSRGPASFGNIAMDQYFGGPLSGAKRTHLDLVACSMTFNCLSSEGLEAQTLGWLVMSKIRQHKRALMKAGLHRVAEEINIGSESAPGAIVTGDPTEIILVPLSVPFYFQDAFSVEETDKNLLTGVNLALTSERVAPLRAPGMNGRVLQVERTTSLTQRVRTDSKTASGPVPRKK